MHRFAGQAKWGDKWRDPPEDLGTAVFSSGILLARPKDTARVSSRVGASRTDCFLESTPYVQDAHIFLLDHAEDTMTATCLGL